MLNVDRVSTGPATVPESATLLAMIWHDYIHADPKVAAGAGCRFLLDLFARGWTREEVLQAYPQLTAEALQAVFAFAAEVLHDRVYAARRVAG
jgi:uncharacterized protein (DUF433 family)